MLSTEKVATRHIHTLLIACAFAIPLVWFFGTTLLGGKTFSFRDAAHFYHPLFEWTTAEWRAGRVPLWNPQENLGSPVLADTTASVFYLGTAVFFLPLSYATNYNLYVSLHVLLALATTFLLAKAWRATTLAASLAAIAYVFGGKVLFEHSNVIFLVSAAWLPLALLSIDRMLTRRDWRSAIVFAVVQALTVLGGDPQTAYHSLLLAAGYAILLWRSERRMVTRSVSECVPRSGVGLPRFVAQNRLVLLLLSTAFAGTLAAVQILPAREWTRTSDRAAYEKPRNIYEAAHDWRQSTSQSPDNIGVNTADGLLGDPVPGHHRLLYRFSIGPWRLPELFWPNVFGRWLPDNHRWLGILLVENFVWTPSLYMGILPLLLALRGWRIRGEEPRWAGVSWMVLFGIVGAFGEWGLGSLVEFAQYATTREYVTERWIGRPVGGLYWLMVTLVPSYAYFRFPAKLWTLAALGIALLAARGWDRLFHERPQIDLRRWFGFLGRQSAVGVGVTLVLIPFWSKCMRYVPKEALMGAIDADAAWWDVLTAFSHTLLVCAAFWWICTRFSENQNRLLPALALLLVALDITIANRWLVQTGDESVVRQTPRVVDAMLAHGGSLTGNRVYRGTDWSPHDWWQSTSPTRLADTFQWRHDTLYPKFHLRNDVALVESQGTLTSADFHAFMEVSRKHGVARPDGAVDPPPAILRALSTKFLVLPDDVEYPEATLIDRSDDAKSVHSTAVWRLDRPSPRAWIVRDVATIPPIETHRLDLLRERTEAVLFLDGEARDLSRTAVVETHDPIVFYNATLHGAAQTTSPDPTSHETCELRNETPQRLEIAVEMLSAGLVILNDLYYPGWKATVCSEGEAAPRIVPIHRVNRIMRGVVLPAGSHRIVYSYEPPAFRAGWAISGLSWSVLIIVGAAAFAARRLSGRLPLALPTSRRNARVEPAFSKSGVT